jgi:hypothetical protein
MNNLKADELLILTKTYPSPSETYRETTCVAAINRGGEMRRLFPVPYRLLEGDAQFKKVGALYWKCVQAYGAKWEGKFRQRLEVDFKEKDLLFLMGTIHRFPDQWLIVGLVYPPKQPPKAGEQQLGLILDP